MRLFISWSGPLSGKLAKALYDWLAITVHSLEPYMSEESIEKGSRWASHIGKELEQARFGIVILTPDNLTAPWLLFEAGAIAKSLDESKLAPILFNLRAADVQPPLSQFQMTAFHREEMLKLIRAINGAGDAPLMQDARLTHLFDLSWPELEQKVDSILSSYVPKKPRHRSTEDVLEEILILVREQANPERLLGRSVHDLTSQIVDAYFSAEARLTSSERNAVLALFARWKALSTRLIEHFQKTEFPTLGGDSLRSQVAGFARYLDEARQAMAIGVQKANSD